MNISEGVFAGIGVVDWVGGVLCVCAWMRTIYKGGLSNGWAGVSVEDERSS